jgi:hypothetical protein
LAGGFHHERRDTMSDYRVAHPHIAGTIREHMIPGGMEDQSYRNDVCPRFGLALDREDRGWYHEMTLWVDHADREEREEDWDRFSVSFDPWGRGEHETAITTDDLMEAWAGLVAVAFAMTCYRWIGSAGVAEAVWSNAVADREAGGEAITCGTHDQMDSNEAMDEAFRLVFGMEFDANDDDHVTLWNKAWTLCRRKKFWLAALDRRFYVAALDRIQKTAGGAR